MKKTHYELLVEDGKFPIKEFFGMIDKELVGKDITYNNVMSSDLILSLLSNPEHRLQDVMANNQLIFHTYCFSRLHGRVYEIRDSIANMLLHTDLDIDSSLLKSPLPEIILTVPDTLLKIHNEHTGSHNLYTIYVSVEETDEDKMVRILCVGKANQNSFDILDDALFFFRVNIGPGRVGDSLKSCVENGTKDPNKNKFSVDADRDLELIPIIFQFVLNTLLYITSDDPDVKEQFSDYKDMEKKLEGLKNPAKKRKLLQKMGNTSKLRSFVVGSSINLTKNEQEAFSSRGLSVRFIVGGHWRAQWYGPKDKQYQKPKWIKPYFKGPEIADLIKSVGVIK